VGFCSFALSPSFSLHLRLVLCSFPISNSTCFIGFPDKLVRNSRGADRLLLRGENPESACFQDQKANGGGGKEIAQNLHTPQQKVRETGSSIERELHKGTFHCRYTLKNN